MTIKRAGPDVVTVQSLTQWGGTALTGRDITNDIQGLSDQIEKILKLVVYDAANTPTALTTDGVQWSTEVPINEADTYVEVFRAYVSSPKGGILTEIELGLTCRIRRTNAENQTRQWQASNDGSTWVDLMAGAAHDSTAGGTEYTDGGYLPPQANFNAMPFYIRLMVKTNTANNAWAKVKNSTYGRVIYSPD